MLARQENAACDVRAETSTPRWGAVDGVGVGGVGASGAGGLGLVGPGAKVPKVGLGVGSGGEVDGA